MKKSMSSASVLLLFAAFACATTQSKPTASSSANVATTPQSWVDAALVKQLLTTGLVYPTNKTSIVNHLDKVGGKLAGLDMSRLKSIPDKTFMSADEIISSAK